MTTSQQNDHEAHTVNVEVATASDLVLDWLVSTAAGHDPVHNMQSHGDVWHGWWERGVGRYRPMPRYVNAHEISMKLLDKALIGTVPTWGANAGESGPDLWRAGNAFEHSKDYIMTGPDRLTAGLRCFAADRLGPLVQVPVMVVNQACDGIPMKQKQTLDDVLKEAGVVWETNLPSSSGDANERLAWNRLMEAGNRVGRILRSQEPGTVAYSRDGELRVDWVQEYKGSAFICSGVFQPGDITTLHDVRLLRDIEGQSAGDLHALADFMESWIKRPVYLQLQPQFLQDEFAKVYEPEQAVDRPKGP